MVERVIYRKKVGNVVCNQKVFAPICPDLLVLFMLKNVRWGPADIFLPSEMLAGVPLAFFALKNARWGPAGIF